MEYTKIEINQPTADQNNPPTNPFSIPLGFNFTSTSTNVPPPNDPPPQLIRPKKDSRSIFKSPSRSGRGSYTIEPYTVPNLLLPNDEDQGALDDIYTPQAKNYRIQGNREDNNPPPATTYFISGDQEEGRNPISNISGEEDPTYVLDHSLGQFHENPLGGLLSFYINRKLKMDWTNFLSLFLSLAVTSGALTFYPGPNIKYAKGDLLLAIAFVSSALVTNGFGTFYIASQVFNSFVDELPPQYRAAINKDYQKNKPFVAARIAAIAALSLITASPYGFAADLPLEAKIILCLCTSVSSYFSLDKYLLKHSQSIYHKLFSSQEAKKYKTLLASFRHSIETVSREIVKSKQLPPELGPNRQINSTELLRFFAQKAKECNVTADPPMTALQLSLRRYLPTLLGIFSTSGLLILLIRTYERLSGIPNQGDNPFNTTRNATDDFFSLPITASISVPFLYQAFTFGAIVFQTIADVISGNSEKPLAFQLHPIKTLLTMLSITSIVSLSYGTIAQLLEEDFLFNKYLSNEEYPEARTFIFAWCIIGALIYNLVPDIKLGHILIEESTRWFGQDKAEKELAHFSIEIRNFLERLEEMSPEKFASSFQDLSPAEINQLLPTYEMQHTVETMLDSLTGTPTTHYGSSGFLSKLEDGTKEKLNQHIHTLTDDELVSFLEDPAERNKVLNTSAQDGGPSQKASPEDDDDTPSEDNGEGFFKSCANKISNCCFSFFYKSNFYSNAKNYDEIRQENNLGNV